MKNVRGRYYGLAYAVDQNGTPIRPRHKVELQAEFYEGESGTVAELDLRESSEGYSVIVDMKRGLRAFRPSEVVVL